MSSSSLAMRYQKWWLGGERADIHVFLAEEFGETQKGLRIAMFIGAILFFLRGVLEIWSSVGPGWEQEFFFRLAGGMLFATIGYVFGSANTNQRPQLIVIYLFLYVAATLVWVPQHNLHIGYLAVPVMLCTAFGVLMWPKIDGLHWPVLAVVVPTLVMLLYHASVKDVFVYAFYFAVSIIFAITIRRTRLRTAFALFIFREKLRDKLDRDPLTGLLNRAGWREQAGNVCEAARQSGLPATILFFDIDHFKKVNDEHGHATGDKVLIHAANIMEESLRPGDVLARLGGEEFVAALLGVAASEGEEIANRVRQNINDSKSPIPITISAGVAEVTSSIDLTQAMHQADMSLLEAKSRGRNQVCVSASNLLPHMG